MRTNRRWMGAVTVAVLVMGAGSAVSSEARPGNAESGDGHGGRGANAAAVLAWNKVAVDTLNGLPGPAGGAPPAAQVHVAMVQGAMFDAVNSIGRRHFRSYALTKRFPAGASVDAAVAAAAHGVLRHVVATVPASPSLPEATRTATLESLAAQYASALDDVPDGRAEDKGVAAGEAAAQAMIATRRNDGRYGPSPWVPDPGVGHWWPQTDPATGQQLLDPTPWVGEVKPFTLESAGQFRTAGPPALSSRSWARQFNEVKAIGAADSTLRTPRQTYVARWWQSSPVRSWNEVARELAKRNRRDALGAARLLALQNLAAGDAAISCWREKYRLDFWRPWNAIPRAAEDGNPDTEPDADWRPLFAAPYPEGPSGHLCLDGAHTRVLRRAFGATIDGGYSITSLSTLIEPTDAKTRSFGSFPEALDEIVEARIWAGLHFRFGDVQGRDLGKQVARYTANNTLERIRHVS